MFRLQFTTWAEVVVVVTIFVIIGMLGERITPVVPRETEVPGDPKLTITHAREGYQAGDCIRAISPTAILESSEGETELVVLEGAPVTECFPELAQFIAEKEEDTEGNSGFAGIPSILFRTNSSIDQKLPPAKPQALSDGKVDTVVTVIISTSTPTGAPLSTTTEALPLSTTPELLSPPIPTGGGTAPSPENAFPSLDRFDECRIEIFGDSIPETMTETEASLFESCLTQAQ